MITITAPIALTDFGQPFFPLAWKAKNLGADSYIYSATHVAYDIRESHIGMVDKATLSGIIAGGGDAINYPLWIEVDAEENVPSDFTEEEITWGEYTVAINHTIDELSDGKFYTMAHDGSKYFDASVVIASGLDWITEGEFVALQVSGVE